ncbi:MAG: succinylglutamate desuccinylase/aspartoacylase family protein, partial [Gammaproteobacteria bacterium]|nr:succinylglutamate desuccinylase/aspartoacylase family protein [Gammaproteobacteria bacterium]
NLKGVLIAVPVVNIYGVLDRSRYLPDRRDLNRSFPGSRKGSMAARIADVFMQEIVSQCTHGIDLHTGAIHRSNLAQVRANLDDAETLQLAQKFNVPVLINADLRDGSLRGAAAALGVRMLLYEAGQALRLDELSIRAGLHGILNVMREIGMLPPGSRRKSRQKPFIAHSSSWERASQSGMMRTFVPLGAHVKKGDQIAIIFDPITGRETPVDTRYSGVVIGRSELPLVHEGDAIFHIARFEGKASRVAEHVEAFQQDHEPGESETSREPPIY